MLGDQKLFQPTWNFTIKPLPETRVPEPNTYLLYPLILYAVSLLCMQYLVAQAACRLPYLPNQNSV